MSETFKIENYNKIPEYTTQEKDDIITQKEDFIQFINEAIKTTQEEYYQMVVYVCNVLQDEDSSLEFKVTSEIIAEQLMKKERNELEALKYLQKNKLVKIVPKLLEQLKVDFAHREFYTQVKYVRHKVFAIAFQKSIDISSISDQHSGDVLRLFASKQFNIFEDKK